MLIDIPDEIVSSATRLANDARKSPAELISEVLRRYIKFQEKRAGMGDLTAQVNAMVESLTDEDRALEKAITERSRKRLRKIEW